MAHIASVMRSSVPGRDISDTREQPTLAHRSVQRQFRTDGSYVQDTRISGGAKEFDVDFQGRATARVDCGANTEQPEIKNRKWVN